MSIDRNKASRQDLRVLKKNMIYCSGLPSSLSEHDLKSDEYFGQYGKIDKIVISPFPNRNYCSIYITFKHQFQAAIAVLSCNQFQIDRSILWCLFGTMKYCTFFLKKIQCKNLPNCPYLHALDKKNQIEINNSPSEAFPLHKKLAKQVVKRYPQRVRKLKEMKKGYRKLPCAEEIFQQIREIKEIKENKQIKEIKENREIQKAQISGKNEESSRKTSEELNLPQKKINLEMRIKSMLLNQLGKSGGSRLLNFIREEEAGLKETIISELNK